MEQATDLIRYGSALVYSALALAAWRLHRHVRRAASRWIALSFTALAVPVAVGVAVGPEPSGGALETLVRDLLGVGLLAFPLALLHFAAAVGAARRWELRLAVAWFAALSVALLVLPPLTQPYDAVGAALVVGSLLYWSLLSIVVAVRLWRVGRGHATVARRRMRVLGGAALVMTLALLLSVNAGRGVGPAQMTAQLLGWSSAALFLLGASPPRWVRRTWREREEAELQAAEAELMVAATQREALMALLPRIRRLVGGGGAAFLDHTGGLLAADGPALAPGIGTGAAVDADHVVVPLRAAVLVVQGTHATPFFGDEEVGLLRRLGVLVDLALERLAIAEQERESAEALARTNDELRNLLYGISHDLRTPIVTVLGYLEVLEDELPDTLPGDAPHYLERIRVSARYMDALIRDLLELSRVGRTQLEREVVDLEALANDLLIELRAGHPSAQFEVGPLPRVLMNAERARQLLSNLLTNAVVHGQRADLHVQVTAQTRSDGSVTVSVRDDGVGIPQAYRERVFGMFERLEGGPGKGTGIGLTMCRRIVEEVGGQLRVADTAVGAQFDIVLPADVLADSERALI
jgi:signal transduction histidine kinase